MAKVGTLNHPKTLHLAELLNIEPWAALGLLEALWGWVSEYAPQGNLGKHSDAVIADGIKWRKKSDVLIKVLIKSGWIDESEEHRLLIHDWAEHIPDYILKRLQRKGLRPISPTPRGDRADAIRTPNGRHAADPVRAETQPNPTQPNPTSTPRIPSIDDLTVFMVKAKRRNPDADALACGKFYDLQNWCDSEGRPIRSWQKYAGYWIEKNPEAQPPKPLEKIDWEAVECP